MLKTGFSVNCCIYLSLLSMIWELSFGVVSDFNRFFHLFTFGIGTQSLRLRPADSCGEWSPFLAAALFSYSFQHVFSWEGWWNSSEYIFDCTDVKTNLNRNWNGYVFLPWAVTSLYEWVVPFFHMQIKSSFRKDCSGWLNTNTPH